MTIYQCPNESAVSEHRSINHGKYDRSHSAKAPKIQLLTYTWYAIDISHPGVLYDPKLIVLFLAVATSWFLLIYSGDRYNNIGGWVAINGNLFKRHSNWIILHKRRFQRECVTRVLNITSHLLVCTVALCNCDYSEFNNTLPQTSGWPLN